MDNDHPQTPPVQDRPDSSMSDSPQKYVPQFSAATQMILKRIQSGNSATALSTSGGASGGSYMGGLSTSGGGSGVSYMGGTARFEDMRRTVVMGMKTSMNMELPNTPTASNAKSKAPKKSGGSARKLKAQSNTPGDTPSASGSAAGGKGKGKGKGKAKAGNKRKRAEEDESESTEESDAMSQLGEDSDDDELDEEISTELPKITQSGRQINKPISFVPSRYEAPPKKRATQPKRNQEQALCKRCARGHSPEKNMIVFCDGCNLCWHQLCHDPIISEDTVKDEAAPWYCTDCTRKRGSKLAGHDSIRGVSWQGRSDDEKRNYFSSLPHHHLVSLLMQSTILHPNIPIFPGEGVRQVAPHIRAASSRANSHPQQPFPPSGVSAAGLFPRSENNPRGSMNFIRKIPPGSTPPNSSFSTAIQAPLNNQNPPHINSDSRESTPASPPYPKPGNGLMAKLGPDEEDLEWLVDDNDFDAFSHTVYDEHGNPQVLQGDVGGIDAGLNGGNTHSHGHGMH